MEIKKITQANQVTDFLTNDLVIIMNFDWVYQIEAFLVESLLFSKDSFSHVLLYARCGSTYFK